MDPITTPQPSATNIATEVKCPNCGTPIVGEYCSNCGQRSNQKRLTLRTFVQMSLRDITKVNSGFVYTALKLALSPWDVIRDYIRCRRVRYTSPVAMLLVLLIYFALLSSITDIHSKLLDFSLSAMEDLTSHTAKFLYDLMNIPIIVYLMFSIPISIAVYVTYFNRGARRFNAGEYLAAAIYMICTMLIYDILALPLKMIDNNLTGFCQNFIVFSLFVVTLFKAFHVKGIALRLTLIALCLTLVVIGIIAVYILMGTSIAIADKYCF